MAIALAGSVRAADALLGPAEARGKVLYTLGRSTSGGEVVASIAGGIDVPASQHPCIQCHGRDGSGGEQAGIQVPDIRATRIFAPYGMRTALGDLRPAYDAATLGRALGEGVHSGGGALDPMMPRYALSDADLADLLAYLKVLGAEPEPGVRADRILVGAMLPLTGPQAQQGRGVEQLLRRYFAQRNTASGIDGRRIELRVSDVGAPGRTPLEAARELLSGPDAVLCMLASFPAAMQPAVVAELESEGVPLVGPLSLAPRERTGESTFYLLASLEDEGRAVARFVDVSHGVAVVFGSDPGAREMAAGVRAELEARGAPPARFAEWGSEGPGEIVAALREAAPSELIVLTSSARARDLAVALGAEPAKPARMIVSSVLLGGAVPFAGQRIAVVSPGVAPGSPADMARLGDLLASDAGRPSAGPMTLTAFAAAELLTTALERSGRHLDRAGVVRALSEVRDLRTGVMPPIGFGPTRRVAARGALFVVYEPDGRRGESRWVELPGA